MKNSTSLFSIAIFGILLITLQGCASLSNKSGISTEKQEDPVIYHTIAPGDRLGDIALRYTGAISRWEAIAAFNDIDDPRTLRIGDVVSIPRTLVPDNLLPVEARANSKNAMKVASSSNTGSDVAATTTGTMAVKRPANSNAGVIVRPVTVNRTFELSPLDTTQQNNSPSSNSAAPQVRVIGTYYPKGIYQQPASYSTLMMRVAPGSTFELDREVNDWYKIITDEGVGYLRTEDGVIVSENSP